MANWKELLKEGDIESTLSSLSTVPAVAGDSRLIFDASDGGAIKKASLSPEYITMQVGWRAPIQDSNGGYRQYFPFETIAGDYYWGRYWSGDITTNGTVPSSINVGNVRDTSSSGGGYRPNNAMGWTVPVNCTAFVYGGSNNKNPDTNAGTGAGNNISVTFYHGTPTNNATTQFDELFTHEFDHPTSNGTILTGLSLVNGMSGVDLSAGDCIIPSIMSNASSGTGTRSCYGTMTMLLRMF